MLPKDLRGEMLDLTGDIAHNVVRVAVPWSSYLIGVAVGRGASPEEALRIVRELLPPPVAADDFCKNSRPENLRGFANTDLYRRFAEGT